MEQGYHRRVIPKGQLGNASKITEEYEEFIDACDQGNKVMALIELSDLLGAIDAYVRNWNMDISDLLEMTEATQRAFRTGRRK